MHTPLRTFFIILATFASHVCVAQAPSTEQKIVAASRAADDNFGSAVDISGDYAIVGAYGHDLDATGAASLNTAGAAYIYRRVGTAWIEQQKLIAPDRAADDLFGCSVAISGDYAIVGASSEKEDAAGGASLVDAGSAYIFVRSGAGWTFQQKLVAPDRASGDLFGAVVDIDGDYAIIGAFQQDADATGTTTVADAGAAYVFKRMGTSWSASQKLVAPDRATFDLFGFRVAISGDRAVVGAFVNDTDSASANPVPNAGAAYIFQRTGNAWTQEQKIVASDRSGADFFGRALDISGDYIVVGAVQEDEDETGANPMTNAGSVYIFHRNATGWVQEQKIVSPERSAGDFFGGDVSIDGTRILVAAWSEDEDLAGSSTVSGAGGAYFFTLQGGVWTAEEKIVASDRFTSDGFAFAVGVSGNYTIAGAPGNDRDTLGTTFQGDAGAAYIFQSILTAGITIPAPASAGLRVAPVPATDKVVVLALDTRLHRTPAEVVDMLGRVRHRFIVRESQSMDVSTWPSGIYFIRLSNGMSVRMVKR